MRRAAFALLALLAVAPRSVRSDGEPKAPPRPAPFGIHVLDRATKRGVPLVTLTTVHGVSFVTDDAGWAAIDEPAFFGQRVFFEVKSHGYTFPNDGFGFVGTALDVKPGGRATLEVDRVNVAERLYRVTGEGLYRDSLLLGEPVPLRQPLLNGGVVGQDSCVAVVYRGKVHWFWGDTNRLAYPLGHFATAGATSLLPGQGGLDPAVGIDLAYWTEPDGFSRRMCPIEGGGPVWIDGLVVVPDATGRERLVACFARMKDLGTCLERGLAVFDDEKQVFVKQVPIPLDAPLYPRGHAFKVKEPDGEWVCFGNPFPEVRVKADWEHLSDLAAYEGFSCLAKGARVSDSASRPVRDEHGQAQWAWRVGAEPLHAEAQREWVARGLLTEADAPYLLRDMDGDRRVTAHAGSLAWNEHHKRWAAVVEETNGSTSLLGEVWYAEADSPIGPWAYAKKVVTHDRYSFYNPVQHPFLDTQHGRYVWFEGTYATTFSGNTERTPRYDYNQILYRLDLDDPRAQVPVAVYSNWHTAFGAALGWTKDEMLASRTWGDQTLDLYDFAFRRAGPPPILPRRSWPSMRAFGIKKSEFFLDTAAEPGSDAVR